MVTEVYVGAYTESCGISYFVMFVNDHGQEMSPYKTANKENAESEAEAWRKFFGLPNTLDSDIDRRISDKMSELEIANNGPAKTDLVACAHACELAGELKALRWVRARFLCGTYSKIC